jgi:hypothetical protein
MGHQRLLLRQLQFEFIAHPDHVHDDGGEE